VQLLDVNVLVEAFREDAPRHAACITLVNEIVNGHADYACSDLVLSGFLRVVTHPKVFITPSPLGDALEFANTVRNQPHAHVIQPGERHWSIFVALCSQTHVKGNLVPDAFFAALAIEHGCEWVSLDADFSRFPGLRWRHPLKAAT
jgi:toxin-antitoxin system PIN domain toxin